jgi:hypothetical protein
MYYLKKGSSISYGYRTRKAFFEASFYSPYIPLSRGMIASIVLGTEE